jgi:hypothetical protein
MPVSFVLPSIPNTELTFATRARRRRGGIKANPGTLIADSVNGETVLGARILMKFL